MGTVSNVIRGTVRVSPALRARVEAAIRDLDFHPNEIARSLKVNQTYMLGMVLSDVTNPFFPQLIRGAEDRALERGFLLVTANSDEQRERECRIISALRSRRVDGILLTPTGGKNFDHIQRTIESGIPVVCLDRAPNGIKVDAVLLDNVRGSQECVRHLIRTGYRKIAIVTGPLALGVARERLQGYEKGLREAGLSICADMIREGDFFEGSGYRLAKELLLQFDRPDAILVSNGVMALGVLQAFEELEVRCPEDVGLATFDDLAGNRAFHPRLTVVAQPGNEIGALGATLLMDRIEGKLTRKNTVMRVAPTLIVRDSTRARALAGDGSAHRAEAGSASGAQGRNGFGSGRVCRFT